MPPRLANLHANHIEREVDEDYRFYDDGAAEPDLRPWFEDTNVLVYIDRQPALKGAVFSIGSSAPS